jgi:chemotaxis protein MotB
MKTKSLLYVFIFFSMFFSFPAFADLFYWPSEYKAVYDDKVAIEIQYEKIKKEYANEKSRLESLVRGKEAAFKKLSDDFDSAAKSSANDKKLSAARIKELNDQLVILRGKSGSREKELIDENKKMSQRFTNEIEQLKKDSKMEIDGLKERIASLTKEYNESSNALNLKIREQEGMIASLKKLSETQRNELARMSQQSGELEKQLTEEIKKGQIRLKRLNDRIIINLDDKICFDSGSAVLKPEIKKSLDKIAVILSNYPENRISVEGNTDNIPIHNNMFRNNWQLSTERALSVLEYLLENIKLNPERTTAAGNGEFKPDYPNDTPENRALNRRVDIVVFPKASGN